MTSTQSELIFHGQSRRPRWIAIVVCLITIASALTGMANATAATTVNVQHMPLFGGEYFASPYTPTLTQAVSQATAFDFILAPRTSMYASYANSMHTANPRLKLLVYLEGEFSYPTQASSYPESWFAHNSSGNRITSIMFPGNYLMDPSNSGWVGNRSNLCASMLKAAPGYDGCVVDDLGRAPFYKNYVTSTPYDSATHANWTPNDWLKATTKLGSAIKAAIAPKWVIANALSNGRPYWDPTGPTSQVLAGVDGGMAETFVRSAYAGITAYPDVTSWLDDVRMVSDAAAHGKYLLTAEKIWVSGTQAQYAAWDMYGMATFLMGYGGMAYFHFRTDKAPSSTATVPTTIGTPSGAFYQTAKGYYQRDFSNGVVLFNPGATSYSVSLPKPYRNLSGTWLTSITLSPTSGTVLMAS